MNKIHNVSSLKFFQYCSQLNMIFKMNLFSLSNNILIQDQISKKWATYNVPLFLKQMIIKTWEQKFIIFLFLLHIPINLKCSKQNIITAWKESQSQLWHSSITANSHRAMTILTSDLPLTLQTILNVLCLKEKCWLFTASVN